jgi:hypothetical protein
MLMDNMKEYISKALKEIQGGQNSNDIKLEIFKEELEYIERNPSLLELVNNNITLVEQDTFLRFMDSYIERCDKETETVIANESSEFLNVPVHFLKSHKNEFIYLESKWFDFIGVDAISLEVDDAFGTYDIMLGLKLQKKYEQTIKTFLNTHLHGEGSKFDLVFSLDDGLWNVNFTLNYIEGFQEEITIGEAYRYIYAFLFQLVEAIELAK